MHIIYNFPQYKCLTVGYLPILLSDGLSNNRIGQFLFIFMQKWLGAICWNRSIIIIFQNRVCTIFMACRFLKSHLKHVHSTRNQRRFFWNHLKRKICRIMQIALTQTFDDYPSSKTSPLPQVVFAFLNGKMSLWLLYDLLANGLILKWFGSISFSTLQWNCVRNSAKSHY